MIDQGDMLPDVGMTDADGAPIALRSFVGRPLVLYFYPKDDTPGCTREAQDFSALSDDFAAAGAAILGISKDPPAKHRKFIAKHDLQLSLASDEDGAVLDAFGVWIEKSMYGRSYMGIERATFLFDAGGALVQIWRKVKVPGHAQSVLEAVRALPAS
ncbi:peroxiredoxin [Sphingomonas japonica]|uniref:thioredoxin-dependent peroxiredoxin n=1 Tax=Sphingomonas japonica TaxID=511662 RepID=A0ABX0TWV8_9SPHN|nr:peroxiredoxin [Sphingomonas japonica]NIJ22800.1 peroxiredoxin Q/BCP [Sphingomonas japonica]